MAKQVGIWGFGIVGKSVLQFLQQKMDDNIAIWDERSLTPEERDALKGHRAVYSKEALQHIEEFLAENDTIVVSPGIDRRHYQDYAQKFIGELDLFAEWFHKPTIAITGTLGKTTTTTLLGSLSAFLPSRLRDELGFVQERIAVAGNIGRGILDIVDQQEVIDCAVLELSSFQLDLSKRYRPDIALWTNFYPNHLDRHGSLEEYFAAKFKLLLQQTARDIAIISAHVFLDDAFQRRSSQLQSQLIVTSAEEPSGELKDGARAHNALLFFARDNWLWVWYPPYGDQVAMPIFSLADLPDITFLENWLMVLTTLYITGKDLSMLSEHNWQDLDLPHRIEHFHSCNGIDFYNDSKGTVVQATEAAIEKLSVAQRPIILMLGGVSKGVDRRHFVEQLRARPCIKRMVFFGAEHALFPVHAAYATLEEAVVDVMQHMQSGDQVLFSPSGASFDLFKNYHERGTYFKTLVKNYDSAGR